jgi:hypothetical protein
MISAKFSDEQHFCDHYKRNNKGKGRKNLRCFPDCRSTGHVKTGYCGRPVACEVSYDAAAAKDLDLMAFCEFRPEGFESPCGVRLGKTFAFADIIARSRGTGHHSSEKALHPWFPGSVVKSSFDPELNQVQTNFSFNLGNQGWHYAWQSHRMTSATKHELHVFLLAAPSHSTNFTCMCELSSPGFDIHYRRKKTTSPTKASVADSLMSLITQPMADRDHTIGIKRSASEISTDSEGERSISPNQQMMQPINQLRSPKRQVFDGIAIDKIMPSNTVTSSPMQKQDLTERTFQDKPGNQLTSDEITRSLLERIQLLEDRKQQLQTLTLKVELQPSEAPHPETPHNWMARPAAVFLKTALAPASAVPARRVEMALPEERVQQDPLALALLALCC